MRAEAVYHWYSSKSCFGKILNKKATFFFHRKSKCDGVLFYKVAGLKQVLAGHLLIAKN